MKIPERYKTLLSNTGLLFVGTFGSKMISFVMLPLYTSWLSVEDYGTSDIIVVYSTILGTLVSLCIAEAVFVIPTGRDKEDQKRFFSSAIAYGIVSLAILATLYLTIHFVFANNKMSFFSNIGYITLLCSTSVFSSVGQQFCKCINKIKIFAFTGIINTVSVATLGFLLIRNYGLMGYVLSIVIANIISLLYVFLVAKLYEYISIRSISKAHLLELLKYSIPLIPNSVIWLIVSYVNRPVMEASLGMAAIALFSLANRFPTLITTLYNNFSNSWQISVLQEYGKEGYENFYNRTCLAVFVALSICVSCIAIVIGPIIHLLFNENYYPTIDFIPWLCLSTPFMALASIVGANFSAIKQSKYFLYSSVWSAGSAIVFNILLIPIIGLWGACISNVVSFAVGALSRLYYSRNIVRFKWISVYILISVLTIATLALRFFHVPTLILIIIVSIEIIACVIVAKKIIIKKV